MRSWFTGIFSILSCTLFAQVRINEVQTSNENTLYYLGETPDWIELKSTASTLLNLAGWMLSDELKEPNKFVFQSKTIQPNEIFLIYATNTTNENAVNETTFGLQSGKDTVYLFNADTVLIDQLFQPCIPSNKSAGYNDSLKTITLFNTPTPGQINHSDTIQIELYADELSIFPASGFYTSSQEIQLRVLNPKTAIYFSLNGDEPEEDEELYTNPITLYNKKIQKDKLADEPTSPHWKEPDGPIFKSNVIRAQGYYKGCPVTEQLFASYFIDPEIINRYNVPVASIITDRDNFFDYEEGIYVPGINFNPADAGYSGNYFEKGGKWERQAELEIFTPNGTSLLAQHVGVRINGNTSRSYAQKSLRIYGKNDIDSIQTLNLPFFKDRDFKAYETVVFRTPSADVSNTFFKDMLCHRLAKELNVDYQDYQPAVVFLNGEYWGIHNIRERQDEYYLERLYGVKEGTYDLISMDNFSASGYEVVSGNLDEYNWLLNYANTHDLSQDQYMDTLYKLIDISNFIDYNILQLFVANTDWGNANTKFWKSYEDDAKWRWLFFDCDRCFTDFDNDRINVITGNTLASDWPSWATDLQRAMLQNERFKNQFISRFNYALTHVFTTGNMLRIIDEFERIYKPLAFEHVKRWQLPETVYAWNDNIEGLREFALQRPQHMTTLLEKNFGLPLTVYPNPASTTIWLKDVANEPYVLKVELIDVTGNTVYSSKNYHTNSSISITNLQAGYYIIQATLGERVYNLPLIKN